MKKFWGGVLIGVGAALLIVAAREQLAIRDFAYHLRKTHA